MSIKLTVTSHRVITVYNGMFDHTDCVMRALAEKKTLWDQDLSFTVKLARQRLPKYHAKVTAMTGMHVISAPILDRFRMLRSFRMSDKGMDIDPEDETSNITQYQETFLHYVDNEYFAKHRGVPVNKHKSLLSSNLIPSVTASASSQSFFD